MLSFHTSKTINFVFYLLLVLILSVDSSGADFPAGGPPAAGPSANEQRTVVKIGLIFPLSGPMASFGQDIVKALPLITEKFNSEQTKYKFELIMEDGKFGHTNAAITAAKKLVSVDGVKFLVTGSSGETLQVAPFTESAKVITVAGFSIHPDIKRAGDYVFRTFVDAERGIDLVVQELATKNLDRVAIISEETSFTSAVKKVLSEKLGAKSVFADDFALGETDFGAILSKAKQARPTVYYLNISTPGAFITLLQRLKSSGAVEPIYTYYVPSLPEVQKSLGQQLGGVVYLDYPATPGAAADFEQFFASYKLAAGGAITAEFNFRTNYNAIKVIYDAVVEVGPDPLKVKEFLYKYDRPSATGQLQFDSNGDAKNLNLELKTYVVSKSAQPPSNKAAN
jgi:branched-chain amino acid transport system substrate-binding protein